MHPNAIATARRQHERHDLVDDGGQESDPSRLAGVLRSMRGVPSRRDVLRGLAAVGLSLGLAVVPTLAEAKPKRRPQAGAKPNPGARRRRKRRKQRRPRFKVVTRTFASSVPITIPIDGPASPFPSTIPVGGLRAGRILDVNVTLSGLSHTYPGELLVILAAPNGQRAVGLMSDAGGPFDVTDITLTFDDQAATFLPYAEQIASASYKPTFPGSAPGSDRASLRTLNGLNPNGMWRLYVSDITRPDGGSIAGWALTIRARIRA